MRKYSLVLTIIFVFTYISGKSQEVISITSLGITPDSEQNVIPFLEKALELSRGSNSVIIKFPKGTYHFYPSEESLLEDNIYRRKATVGILLKNRKNLVIDGDESNFIFHGKMHIAHIDNSENIQLKNFTVDWVRPMTSQGEILDITDDYLDLKVDKKEYPYIIENDTAFFLGENWKLPIMTQYSTQYNKSTREIAYNTWDAGLGEIFEKRTEEISEGVLRFYGKVPSKSSIGNIVSLFHVRYFPAGIHMTSSKNITLTDLTLFHTLGHGFLGERTENITMNNASVKVNDNKGRYFSSIADASHFYECKGVIKVLNCSHTGQGDDFINVHGGNIRIQEVLDDYTLLLSSKGRGRGKMLMKGDEYWFINKDDGQRGEFREVKESVAIMKNGTFEGYKITFTERLPKQLQSGDFIENKTWTAGLEIRGCSILKRNRARGILVTTPKDVIIEDNYFRSAGTAILIEGDISYWFESGANNNVKIQNNVFDNCLTSGHKTENGANWGKAVITISPSFIPQSLDGLPYHKNITISNNIFRVFDAPLLSAASVDGLNFTNNSIINTFDFLPYTLQREAFSFNGCRNINISNNLYDKNYNYRDITIKNMRTSDIKFDKNELNLK